VNAAAQNGIEVEIFEERSDFVCVHTKKLYCIHSENRRNGGWLSE
jgi:hypothetical protein